MSWHQTEESLVGFINCVNIHAALSGNLGSLGCTCIPLITAHLGAVAFPRLPGNNRETRSPFKTQASERESH